MELFGVVYSGRYESRDDVFEDVVVKQLHTQTKESKRLFLKEHVYFIVFLIIRKLLRLLHFVQKYLQS